MSLRVPALAAVLGLLLLPMTATPALAHVRLAETDPSAGSTVEAVVVVTLVFTEALKETGSSFTLLGPDGEPIGRGAVTGPRRMALDVPALAPGDHTVRWTAVAIDGHVERGRFSFAVAAASATSAPPATPTLQPQAAGTASPVVAATAAPADAASGAAGEAASQMTPPEPSGPQDGAGADAAQAATATPDVLTPLVAGSVVVALVGFLVLRRSRTA